MAHPTQRMSKLQHSVHAVLALAAFILLAKPEWMPRPEFGKAVGEAVLIALLIIYLVEVHSHKRLGDTAEDMIRKIGKNIIPLVYGHELPTPLVEALEANTLQQPVYREKMRLDVELTPTQLGKTNGELEQLCRLETTYSYALVNCSDDPVKRPCRISLERDKWLAERIAGNDSDPVMEYVQVGNLLYVDEENKAKVIQKLNFKDGSCIRPLIAYINPSPDGNVVTFEESNFVLPPRGRCEIAFNGVLFKRYSDNEVWSTAYPTLGVSLSVTSVHFEVEARFPDSAVKLLTNQGAMTSRWAYDAPLLAGQAVIFWWRPKKA